MKWFTIEKKNINKLIEHDYLYFYYIKVPTYSTLHYRYDVLLNTVSTPLIYIL